MRRPTLLVLTLGLSTLSAAEPSTVAATEEAVHFSGTYCWQQDLPIAVTLRRTAPGANTFRAVWQAFWPDGKDNWHRYEGDFTIDETKGTASGSGTCPGKVGGTFSGKVTGKFPQLTFTLTYTGGNYNGPRTMRLSAGPLTKEPILLQGQVTAADAASRTLTVSGQVLDKTGRPVLGKDRKPLPDQSSQICYSSGTKVLAGSSTIAWEAACAATSVRVTAYRTGDGFLVQQITMPAAAYVNGRIVSVEAERGLATLAFTPPKEKTERSVSVRVSTAREFAKAPATALSALTAGQTFSASLVGEGDRWAAISFQAGKAATP